MAQQNINTGTLPNDKTGDSLRTAMIKVQNNFSELYTTAPISNSVNIGNTTSNVLANSTTVFIGNSGTYSLINSTSITATLGYHSQVLNSGSNNLVIGTTNATSVLVYTNGITSANLRAMVAANGNVGIGNGAPNELLTVGGTLSANQLIIGNTTVNFTINATFIPATANYALSANTSNYIGSLIAANVVSNAQLSANLSNYLSLAGVAANVLVVTANNTTFVGSVSAANVVSNAQLSANISGLSSVYQTMSGLSANVATLTSNNTLFVGTVSAANVVSNAQLTANLSNYQTTVGLNANIASYLPTYTGIVNASSVSIGNSTTNSTSNTSGFFINGVTAGVPPGTVIHVASSTAPSGFIKANGAAVNRTTYAALFASIGTTFGAGDGSTTFNLPDLRGQFVRSWADDGTVDSGRAFGSTQADAYLNHSHGITDPGHSHIYTSATNPGLLAGGGSFRETSGPTTTSTTGITINNSTTGGTETRPKNVALLACIKY